MRIYLLPRTSAIQMDNVDASSSNNSNTLCTIGRKTYKVNEKPNTKPIPNISKQIVFVYDTLLDWKRGNFVELSKASVIAMILRWKCSIDSNGVISILFWLENCCYSLLSNYLASNYSSRSNKKKTSFKRTSIIKFLSAFFFWIVLSLWLVSFTFAIHFHMLVYTLCILLKSNIHFMIQCELFRFPLALSLNFLVILFLC